MYKNKIKILRETNGLKQEDVAKILGMNQDEYSKYETGTNHIPIHILKNLADYYNTSIDYLLCFTNEKRPYPRSKK